MNLTMLHATLHKPVPVVQLLVESDDETNILVGKFGHDFVECGLKHHALGWRVVGSFLPIRDVLFDPCRVYRRREREKIAQDVEVTVSCLVSTVHDYRLTLHARSSDSHRCRIPAIS